MPHDICKDCPDKLKGVVGECAVCVRYLEDAEYRKLMERLSQLITDWDKVVYLTDRLKGDLSIAQHEVIEVLTNDAGRLIAAIKKRIDLYHLK